MGASLVEYPDDVKIHARTGDNTTVYELTVNPDDRGRVIGKSGQTIHALRSIVAAAAALQGVSATVDVAE